MEPDVVSEVWVAVKLGVPTVRGTPTLCIATENVDDPVLDLFCDLNEVHVITAASWALDLQLITVVLIEPLQTLNQEEIDRKP